MPLSFRSPSLLYRTAPLVFLLVLPAVGNLAFGASDPSLTITPTSGQEGQQVATALNGSGYAAGSVYEYCFESDMPFSGASACPSDHQFTANSLGHIPAGTRLDFVAATGIVVVSGSGGHVLASAVFTAAVPATTSTSHPSTSSCPGSACGEASPSISDYLPYILLVSVIGVFALIVFLRRQK